MPDFIDRLGAELARAASAPLRPQPGPGPRLPLRARPLVIALAILLLASAGAVAGGVLLLRGSPVTPRVPPAPTMNEGAAAIAGSHLLPLRVADPVGGPPWGLRTVRTTRQNVCLQVGRLAFGTIGAIGVDGAFGNDHRFHAFSDNYLNQNQCAELDGRGNAFGNFSAYGIPASAVGMAENGPPSVGCLRGLRRWRPGRPLPCPAQELRNVYFGLLGPQAASVTYVSRSGREATMPTVGSDGAYLVVTGWDAHSHEDEIGSGGSSMQLVKTGPLRAVTYRDGHVCRLRLAWPCANVGFVPAASHLTPAQLTSAVTVRKVRAHSYCDSQSVPLIRPCGARVPSGFVRDVGGPPSELVEISFTARVAVTTSRSYYFAAEFYRYSASCPEIAGSVGTSSNLRAGQRVTLYSLEPIGCKVVHGVVRYRPDASIGPGAEPDPTDPTAITVGRFTIRLP
jgi:hypothetical protein